MSKNDLKLNKAISIYSYNMRVLKEAESYELLMLALLNKQFRFTLDGWITKIQESYTGKKVIFFPGFYTEIPKDFYKSIDDLFKNKFLIKTFKNEGLDRKKSMLEGICLEILIASVQGPTSTWVKSKTYPKITHNSIGKDDLTEIHLFFPETVPLNDLIGYIKNVLHIKNKPKKRKLSLGRDFRILQLFYELEHDKKRDDYAYMEQSIRDKLLEIYKQKMSLDAISKALQRIKKIEKDINKED